MVQDELRDSLVVLIREGNDNDFGRGTDQSKAVVRCDSNPLYVAPTKVERTPQGRLLDCLRREDGLAVAVDRP